MLLQQLYRTPEGLSAGDLKHGVVYGVVHRSDDNHNKEMVVYGWSAHQLKEEMRYIRDVSHVFIILFLQEGKDFDRLLLPCPSFPSVPKANVSLLLGPTLCRLWFQLQDGDSSLPFTLCIQFWFLSEQNCEMKSTCCLEYNLHIFTFCKVSRAFGCPVHVSLTRCPCRHGHLTHESAGCWSLSREECRKGPYLTLGFAWVCLS